MAEILTFFPFRNRLYLEEINSSSFEGGNAVPGLQSTVVEALQLPLK